MKDPDNTWRLETKKLDSRLSSIDNWTSNSYSKEIPGDEFASCSIILCHHVCFFLFDTQVLCITEVTALKESNGLVSG